MCHTLIAAQDKRKYFDFLFIIFLAFFQPSMAPKLLKLSVYFFQWACLKELGYECAFQLYTYSHGLFLEGGGLGFDTQKQGKAEKLPIKKNFSL